ELVKDEGVPIARWRVRFESAPPFAPVVAELVEIALTIDDGAGTRESFDRLGLSPDHPRGLAGVLCTESKLLWPTADCVEKVLWPAGTAVELLDGQSEPFAGGVDDYHLIGFDDFFDLNWSPAEPEPGSGLMTLADQAAVTHVVVADLYVPPAWAGVETEPPPEPAAASAEFASCLPTVAQPERASAVPPSALVKLLLNPRRGVDLEAI